MTSKLDMKGIPMWKIMVLIVAIMLAGMGYAWGEAPAAQAATQPSKLATERAETLKKDIKNFQLLLYYYGPENKPYYHLLLSVPPPQPFTAKTPFAELDAQITENLAKEIIDYLAAEGFLDRAERPNGLDRSIKGPKGPVYMLSLPGHYFEYLGWGLPMLQRLDGLRKLLDGDAAKSMDLLLGRMAGRREEWKKQAATQPAVSSKAVAKDGPSVLMAPVEVPATQPKDNIIYDDGTGAQIIFYLPTHGKWHDKDVEYRTFRISVAKDGKFLLFSDLPVKRTDDGKFVVGSMTIPSDFIASAEILLLGSPPNLSIGVEKKLRLSDFKRVIRKKSWTEQD